MIRPLGDIVVGNWFIVEVRRSLSALDLDHWFIFEVLGSLSAVDPDNIRGTNIGISKYWRNSHLQHFAHTFALFSD